MSNNFQPGQSGVPYGHPGATCLPYQPQPPPASYQPSPVPGYGQPHYLPQQPGFVPPQPGYVPQQPGYLPQQLGYPPQQLGYPPQQYAPQQPQYTAPQPPYGAQQPMQGPGSGLCLTRPEFCRPTHHTFRIKQVVMSVGDSYDVTDSSGQRVFEVDAKLLSSNSRMVLTDCHGRPVVELMKKNPSVPSWGVLNADQRLLANVHKRFTEWDKRVDVELVDGRMLTIAGNVRARKFSVDLYGQPIATVEKERMAITDTYNLTVNPGIDSAFLLALVVCIDQCYHEPESQ